MYKDSSRPNYVALDWKTKHDEIWSKINADKSFGAFHAPQLMLESVVTSFENEWDVLPAGRQKTLHGVGGVCSFFIDISNDSPFTGILKVRKSRTLKCIHFKLLFHR